MTARRFLPETRAGELSLQGRSLEAERGQMAGGRNRPRIICFSTVPAHSMQYGEALASSGSGAVSGPGRVLRTVGRGMEA
jgi:hypothetical protein